jgi:hypothetical protein
MVLQYESHRVYRFFKNLERVKKITIRVDSAIPPFYH